MAKTAKENKSVKENALCALLSYLLVGIIWYFVDPNMKKDNFVKFHVKQGIILFIASLTWSVLLGILFGPSMLISFGLLNGVYRILSLVPWIFVVLGIITAINGKEAELPVIGKYAKKLNF